MKWSQDWNPGSLPFHQSCVTYSTAFGARLPGIESWLYYFLSRFNSFLIWKMGLNRISIYFIGLL